jgi:hypothetical protein
MGARTGAVFMFIPPDDGRDGDGCPEMEKPLRAVYIPSNGNVPARDGLAGGTPPPPFIVGEAEAEAEPP